MMLIDHGRLLRQIDFGISSQTREFARSPVFAATKTHRTPSITVRVGVQFRPYTFALTFRLNLSWVLRLFGDLDSYEKSSKEIQ